MTGLNLLCINAQLNFFKNNTIRSILNHDRKGKTKAKESVL